MESPNSLIRLLSFVREGVITTDIDGRILLLNPAAEKLLGVDAEEAIGRPHEEIFHFVRSGGETPIPSPITRTLQLGTASELALKIELIPKNSARRFPISGRTEPNFNAE